MVNIEKIAAKYRQEIYANLEKLVNINSFSANIPGLHNLADHLIEIAAQYGITLEKQILANDPDRRPHLFYRNNRRKDYYAFIGHFDTVHPPDSDFNRLIKNEDTWVGPGVNDMKNGVLIALYTIVMLKELMPLDEIPVRILFNCDEEISSYSSRQIIETELKDAKAGFVFESGRLPGDLIVTQRKGVVGLDIEVIGKPSHAGESPQTGVNAVVDAAKLIEKLEGLNNLDEGTSVQCTEISGGVARNVIPDRCHIGVDIRVPDLDSQARLFARIETILTDRDNINSQVNYEIEAKRPPFVRTEKSAELIGRYQTVAAQMGFDIRETSSGGVSDACNLSGFGVPVIDGLGALGRFPHTKKEYMVTQSLFDRLIIFSTFFYQLLQTD